MAGHLDTVPANNNAVPRIEGDVLHGLGAADMKSGVAVLLRLAEEVADDSRFDCTFVFYEAEEIADEHNGLRKLFADRPDLVAGDFAVLLEPTDLWLEAGCQGSIRLEATFQGQPGPHRPAVAGRQRRVPRRSRPPATGRATHRRSSRSTGSSSARRSRSSACTGA